MIPPHSKSGQSWCCNISPPTTHGMNLTTTKPATLLLWYQLKLDSDIEDHHQQQLKQQSEELPIAESIYRGGEEGLLQKIQVGVEEVKEQLGNLRVDKAPGPDNMQPRVLMEEAEQVSEMLTDIFNSSPE